MGLAGLEPAAYCLGVPARSVSAVFSKFQELTKCLSLLSFLAILRYTEFHSISQSKPYVWDLETILKL